jgi:hypothetical protein
MLPQQACDRPDVAADESPVQFEVFQSQTGRALFHVLGDSDPSLLPRIIDPVAKLGHVPTRVHASAESGDGSTMTVDLRIMCVAQESAKRIEAALRRTVGVRQVIAVYEN